MLRPVDQHGERDQARGVRPIGPGDTPSPLRSPSGDTCCPGPLRPDACRRWWGRSLDWQPDTFDPPGRSLDHHPDRRTSPVVLPVQRSRESDLLSGCRSTDLARDVCASTWSRLFRACGIGGSREEEAADGIGRWSWGGKQERHAGGPTPPGRFGHSSRPGVDRIRTVKVQVRGRVRASAWPLFCQTGPPCSVCSDEKERTAVALGWRPRGRGSSPGPYSRCGGAACWGHRSRDSNCCPPGSVRI